MKLRRARPLLGTLVDIEAAGARCVDALEAAFGAVGKVHRLMSAQDPSSDVARINRAQAGEVVKVHGWTLEVLQRAQEIWLATSGLFDCCFATPAGLGDVDLLPRGVRVRRPVQLSLDGIAKGFAVDRAVAALQAVGADRGLVNAGGDLRFFGAERESVYVRHPVRPDRLVAIGELGDAAVATSAFYFRGEGRHIVDPRTREPCRWNASATVVAGDCMTADALTKPLLVDPELALPAIERLGARGIRFSGDCALS